MTRQAGKNEVSTRVEASLLAIYGQLQPRPGRATGIKAAPTQDPQAVRSLSRLAAHFRHTGVQGFTAGDAYVTLGAASWWFGSGERTANVVGGTADLLLEFDEAQDFDIEKHDKDYVPMAAATSAPRVYWGTAWSDFDLLETMRQTALEMEARDGRRRVFDVPWPRVAEELPGYGRFVENEIARLGHTSTTPHPIIRTQYELIPMAGAGRLFSPAQLALLQGDHPRHDGPRRESHHTYVAGLDVGGANLSGAADPDETVLIIGRSTFPGRGQTANPRIEVVAIYRWQGLDHDAARYEIHRLITMWRVAHVAIDATGIGEPLAAHLAARLEGPRPTGKRVTMVKVTREAKSSLGFDMLAAVNTGSLKLYRPDGLDEDHAELASQARLCRRELISSKLLWAVDPKDGHDDSLFALALLVRAGERGRPRVVTQRSFRS